MRLTKAEIRKYLDLLSYETVAEFNGYKVVKQGHGYSDDPEIGALQAKLSMMLEATRE